MKNGEHLIGLFQGMFEQNIMTFNPGWTQSAAEKDPFMDVRMLSDPDGNQILIDQHR